MAMVETGRMGILVPMDEYKELLRAQELLEATKRIVRANRYGMAETLSSLLDVYLEEQDD